MQWRYKSWPEGTKFNNKLAFKTALYIIKYYIDTPKGLQSTHLKN